MSEDGWQELPVRISCPCGNVLTLIFDPPKQGKVYWFCSCGGQDEDQDDDDPCG